MSRLYYRGLCWFRTQIFCIELGCCPGRFVLSSAGKTPSPSPSTPTLYARCLTCNGPIEKAISCVESRVDVLSWYSSAVRCRWERGNRTAHPSPRHSVCVSL
jgi:hypothetical protein